MSIRLYIGNLPKDIERQELESVFAEFESANTTKVITDRKTGKCRGFGFITAKDEAEANQIIEKFDGYLLNESPLKIEVAQPKAKGKEDSEAPEPEAGSSKRSKGGKPAARKQTAGDSDAVQPDPRWAQDLEKLKQLLAAQTASS